MQPIKDDFFALDVLPLKNRQLHLHPEHFKTSGQAYLETSNRGWFNHFHLICLFLISA